MQHRLIFLHTPRVRVLQLDGRLFILPVRSRWLTHSDILLQFHTYSSTEALFVSKSMTHCVATFMPFVSDKLASYIFKREFLEDYKPNHLLPWKHQISNMPYSVLLDFTHRHEMTWINHQTTNFTSSSCYFIYLFISFFLFLCFVMEEHNIK